MNLIVVMTDSAAASISGAAMMLMSAQKLRAGNSGCDYPVLPANNPESTGLSGDWVCYSSRVQTMSDDFVKRFNKRCDERGIPDQFDDFSTDMPKARHDDDWTPEEWADWWCDEINHCR